MTARRRSGMASVHASDAGARDAGAAVAGNRGGAAADTGGTVARTEPFDANRLAAAALAGATPDGWYVPRPTTAREWATRIEAVRTAAGGSAWLDDLWPAIDAAGPAAERIRRAAERGVIITTGQQPGLFGGPIYTWCKALAALALADALEQACGVPVAPLFWAATDDSDFVEASTTWVSVAGGVEPLSVLPMAAPGTVLAAAPLGDPRAAIAGLAAAAGSAPYGAALDAVRAAYGVGIASAASAASAAAAASTVSGDARDRGPTAGSSYVALLRRVLEPLGIAVLDAAHGAVRQRAHSVLLRALVGADAVRDALVARDLEIVGAGYEPQVSEIAELSLVFRWTAPKAGLNEHDAAAPLNAVRTRVSRAQSRDLAAAAKPGDLSPNVLLRPVVERAILPTVAYVAGPGELAYFAQVSAVAAALDLPAPLAVPRWSCTLIEPSIAALMARYAISLEELRDPHGPEARLARAALPAPLREALEVLRVAIDEGVTRIAAADRGRLVPESVVEGARAHLARRWERLERRYAAAIEQSGLAAMRDLATVRGALRPGGLPQERRLNFVPFLARAGPGLLDVMRGAAARHAAALVGAETSPAP